MHFFTTSADGVTAVRIEGGLDAVTVSELRPFIDTLVEEQHPHIVLDLSNLRLIDSSGVGALVFLYKKAKEYGGAATVHGLCGQPMSIFKLLRLDRVLVA